MKLSSVLLLAPFASKVFTIAADQQAPELLALSADDECRGSLDEKEQGMCTLNALQRRKEVVDIGDETDVPSIEVPEMDKLMLLEAGPVVDCPHNPGNPKCYLYNIRKQCAARYPHSDYCLLNGYMIVPQKYVPGIESVTWDNAAKLDHLWNAAMKHCNSPDCTLVINPANHRSQDQLHIHFRSLGHHSSGPLLKKALEKELCHSHGWKNFETNGVVKFHPYKGKMPHSCDASKVKMFDRFPRIFTEVLKLKGGKSLSTVGIDVFFTYACGGGKKYMVLTTEDCSIEHYISAR